MNIAEKLAREISRVTEIREHYEALRHMPNVIVAPQIAMMTATLEDAFAAARSNDPVHVIRALANLEGFTE